MEIKIYSKSDCRFCQKTRRFFSEKLIPFTEFMIDENMEAKAEMIKNSRQDMVPVIVRDNKHMQIGYDLSRLEKLINF